MRNALHEQLLKAGLVDEKRLEEAEREKRRDRHAPQTDSRQGKKNGRGPQQGRPEQARQAPKQAAAAPRRPAPAQPTKAALDAARHATQLARRELDREIIHIIKANRRTHNDGEEVYNFIDGKKVARIYVSAEMHGQLSKGELSIVRLRSRYAVVSAETAAAIVQKAPDYFGGGQSKRSG